MKKKSQFDTDLTVNDTIINMIIAASTGKLLQQKL